MKRGLVLGGGGVVGVAWEVGLIGGLLEGGVDLRDADVIVGTSAGSIVGTRLAAGQDVRREAPGKRLNVPEPEGGADLDSMRDVFGLWGRTEVVTPEFMAEIGRFARAARTVAPEIWVEATAANCGVSDWPDKPLRLITVDTDTAARAVMSRETGVPLADALAASCSVPGMFPAIEIGGHLHMDGGVASGTSADVLLNDDVELALIVAPIVSGVTVFGELAERCIHAEADVLNAVGVDVIKVLPLPPEKEAFGDNLMDGDNAAAAGRAGFERGRTIAAVLKAKWYQ